MSEYLREFERGLRATRTVRTNRRTVTGIQFDALAARPDRRLECHFPVELHLVGYPGLLDPDKAASTVTVGRCRKCDACMRHRARLWTARAIDEVKSSRRSWFGTLTLHPDQAFRYRLLAERTLKRRASKPYSELTEIERTCAIAKEAAPEITRWLKRVRKNSGALVRYLLVCEPHKSGVPHWHILVHEHEGRASKRCLEQAWRVGFSHWRLVEGVKPAAYVCKYLTKSLLTRVRASAQYGSAGPRLVTERLLRETATGETGTGTTEKPRLSRERETK